MIYETTYRTLLTGEILSVKEYKYSFKRKACSSLAIGQILFGTGYLEVLFCRRPVTFPSKIILIFLLPVLAGEPEFVILFSWYSNHWLLHSSIQRLCLCFTLNSFTVLARLGVPSGLYYEVSKRERENIYMYSTHSSFTRVRVQNEALIAIKCSWYNKPGFLGGVFFYSRIICSRRNFCAGYSCSTNKEQLMFRFFSLHVQC
jgi:hypothetical protein